jgi:peptidoglycan/LPS O-acetylase OafA/YrhL
VLDVTWSLAIEEQFYLIWPLVVAIGSRRMLMRVCAVLVVAALGTRVGLWFSGAHWIAIFSLTPCRMDCLAVGAWIALASRGPEGIAGLHRPARIVLVAALVPLVGILAYDTSFYLTGIGLTLGLTLIALTGGAVLVLAQTHPPMERAFRQGWLRFLGRYSYALYLCHVPVALVMVEMLHIVDRVPTVGGSRAPGQIVLYLLASGVSVALALLSWNLFEKHFLRLKRYFPAHGSEPRPRRVERLDPDEVPADDELTTTA